MKLSRYSVLQLISQLRSESLYKNSIYLMSSTLIMGIVGFFFWTLNARLFTTEQIGIATAMISLTAFLNNLGTLGLNAGIVIYLFKVKDRNKLITTSLVVVALATAAITIFYVLLINVFSPRLLFIRENIYLFTFFTLFVALSAVNMVTDSIFIAYKSAKYVFIYNFFYSISRLLAPLVFISFGALGIFFSHTFGVIVCIILTYYFLIKKFDYKFGFHIDLETLRKTFKFSFGNYTAGLIGNLPSTLFPIFILNQLGPKASAFYYIDMMIIAVLYIIPSSISQSLFAEGSFDESQLTKLIFKSLKLNLVILIPAILTILLFGRFVLLLFGKDYSIGGDGFLMEMALSTLSVPVIYIFEVYLRIHKRISLINYVTTIGTITALLISYYASSRIGLYGIGAGIISGQLIQSLSYTLYILLKTNKFS